MNDRVGRHNDDTDTFDTLYNIIIYHNIIIYRLREIQYHETLTLSVSGVT